MSVFVAVSVKYNAHVFVRRSSLMYSKDGVSFPLLVMIAWKIKIVMKAIISD